ncbi:MAG: SLC45 family MFS transporter [Clostridiaceae bacterium]|jgi:maltose/moltooligosaccharide transporter|nr:SLC45 family MFS transporter [Clostridiaceae bacterium]
MRLNYKRTFVIGLAFFSISSFWQLYDSIIPLILKNTFYIGDTVSGVLMALDNVLALFMLPLFGTLSDRVSTPIGKRMPFIIGGTALAAASMSFLPFGDNNRNLTLFLTALLIVLVSMSTYRSPAVALMPDVTPKPLRSKANAIINLMGALGGAVSLGLIALLVPKSGKPDYTPLFLIVASLMVAAVAVLAAVIRENKLVAEMKKYNGHEEEESQKPDEKSKLLPDVKRSLVFILISVFLWFMAYNAVTTAFSKYAQSFLGIAGGGFAANLLVATAAAVISFVPVGIVSTKTGRKKMILFGITLMFVSFTMAFFITSYHPVLTVLLVLVGIGWASINVNSYPMVVEMSKGSDVGKYTGYYYTFSMAAQILTPILSGAFLEHVGYRTLFPYAGIFMALAFVTMLNVRHGDSKPVLPDDKLEMMDVGD